MSKLASKRKTLNRKIWKLAAFVLLILLTICVALSMLLSSTNFLLLATATVPLVLIAAYQFTSNDPELFSPMNFVFINLLLGVFFQTAIICFNTSVESNLNVDAVWNFELLFIGLVTITASILFLIAGYSLAGNKGLPRGSRNRQSKPPRWSDGKLRFVVLIYGFVSVICLIYFISVFDVLSDLGQLFVKRQLDEDTAGGGAANYARFGMKFAQIACIAVYIQHLTKKKNGYNSALMPMVIILFFIGAAGPILSSSRSSLLFFVVALFAVNHFIAGGWNMRQARIAIIVVVSLILIMGTTRYIQQRSSTYAAFNQEVGLVGSLSKLGLSNNFLGVAKTSVIIDLIPRQQDYLYGSSYFLWVIAPIPRAYWQDKPIIRIGGVLGAEVFGTRDTNGIPPGFVGEAWLNFGALGIPIVSLLFGFATKVFYNKFGRTSYSDVNSLLIYSSLFTLISFSLYASDFSGTVTRVLQLAIPVMLVLSFVRQSGSGARS